MISSVDSYRYVRGVDIDDTHPHGDLDRIAIDGVVMPKREDPDALRGEDVAFLMEAAGQRFGLNAVAGHSQWMGSSLVELAPPSVSTVDFTRRISSKNWSPLYDRLASSFGNGLATVYLPNRAATGSEFMATYSDFKVASRYDLVSKHQRPNSGAPVDGSLVADCFSTLSHLTIGHMSGLSCRMAFEPLSNIDGHAPEGVMCRCAHVEGFDYRDITGTEKYVVPWGLFIYHVRHDGQWRDGTMHVVPNRGIDALVVRMRHAAAVKANLLLHLEWTDPRNGSRAGADVWWNWDMTGSGDVYTLPSDALSSATLTLGLLSLAGWSRPSYPTEDAAWKELVTVGVRKIDLTVTWDDHTAI